MELYIYNLDRELIGIVESFDYLRWTRRYSQCGSFELKAISTPENADLLKEGNIIWKSDDEEAGIIEYLKLSQTDSEFITVSGRFATSLLARRIVWGTENLSGDLSVCAEQLLNHNLISPSDSARQITGVSFSSPNLGVSISTQISYRNLMDAVTGLCDASDIGIKTVFSKETGAFAVTLYNGAVSQAVFSKEYENLTEQVYTESESDYANTALIGGEGEGAQRTFVAITSGSGETRREIFVDAKDLRIEDFGAGYTDALTFRGQSKLNELAMRYTFDTTVNPHGNLTYKIDFDLGQIVKVVSKTWGVTMTTRITEVEETYDADGQSISVVFGKAELTVAQKIRSDMSQVQTALSAPTGVSAVAETLGDLTEANAKIQGDTVVDTINNLFGKLPALEISVGAGTISIGQYALHSMAPGDAMYFTSYSGNKFSDQPSENGHVFLIKHNGDNTGNGYQRAMGFFISRDTMTFYVISVFVYNNPSGQANWLNINNEPVTTARLANGAVTGVKIADRTITASKIAAAFTDYSTTEQNTGCLWIDGKTIYRKEINLGSLPNAIPGSVAHGISNLSTVTSLSGFATNGTVFLPLPLARYNNFASQIGLYADTTNIVVEPGNDRTAYTGYVVIEYTKTS
ncbi:siphovirus ReqiPepy6 Gp37-like family protein [Clostridium tyrobutyricum]|uniref:siphovirus ReqiPepy6 Gp37-like family protein n=1 Tax=Clostridium tyrobutyricum TaxID=1519 RepID=UPI00189E67A5|nr:siphovirus ReqiPepy6 Gp37-like family protein [Clostridium tyrobutyricum]